MIEQAKEDGNKIRFIEQALEAGDRAVTELEAFIGRLGGKPIGKVESGNAKTEREFVQIYDSVAQEVNDLGQRVHSARVALKEILLG